MRKSFLTNIFRVLTFVQYLLTFVSSIAYHTLNGLLVMYEYDPLIPQQCYLGTRALLKLLILFLASSSVFRTPDLAKNLSTYFG